MQKRLPFALQKMPRSEDLGQMLGLPSVQQLNPSVASIALAGIERRRSLERRLEELEATNEWTDKGVELVAELERMIEEYDVQSLSRNHYARMLCMDNLECWKEKEEAKNALKATKREAKRVRLHEMKMKKHKAVSRNTFNEILSLDELTSKFNTRPPKS